MKLAICDDEKLWQKQIETVVRRFFEQMKIEYSLSFFDCGGQMIENNQFDLIFMDMEMSGLTGLETAKKIRLTNDKCAIVFLTSHKEIIKQTFEVRAYRFIEKESYKDELYKCLDDFIKESAEKELIAVRTSMGDIHIRFKDIMWIESSHNGSIVWGKHSEITSSMYLSDWENRLDKHMFFPCHKKYIVNLRWIDTIEEKIKMINGYYIELSRRKKKELKKAYMEYMFRDI